MEAISTWIKSNFQLKARLLWAMEMGTGLDGLEKYLPYGSLERLITPTEVSKHIQKLDHGLARAMRQTLVRHLCGGANVPRPEGAQCLPYYLDTTCKRAFAILVLIDEVNLEGIFYLYKQKIYDVDLLRPRNGRLGEGAAVTGFYRLLSQDGRTKFIQAQWKLLAPIFRNRSDWEVPVFRFCPETVFPWAINAESSMLGTTSNVYPIKIESRHSHLLFALRKVRYRRQLTGFTTVTDFHTAGNRNARGGSQRIHGLHRRTCLRRRGRGPEAFYH